MAISKEEVLALVNAFHDCSTGKGTAAQQAAFFLHPEPRIFILHGEDVSMEGNYEIHQKLTDEKHATIVPAGLGTDFLHGRQPWYLPASTTSPF